MERTPTYILWHRSLKQNSDEASLVVFNVTPLATNKLANGPKKFFTQFLKELNITAKAENWEILPYRSNYLGIKYQPDSWQDYWKKNWRITIKLSEPLLESPAWSDEFLESYALSTAPKWHRNKEELMIGCIIIADFKSETARENTKAAISSSIQVQQLARDLMVPPPEFSGVNIGNKFFQLQIYLGRFTEAFFEHGATYALAVENVCRQLEGITDFYERINTWGDI